MFLHYVHTHMHIYTYVRMYFRVRTALAWILKKLSVPTIRNTHTQIIFSTL